MKKLFAVVLCAALCLSFAGCGAADKDRMAAALCETGRRLLEEGDRYGALDAFTQAVELDPACAEAYIGRGDAYAALDKQRSAAEDYEAALSCSVGDAELFQKLIDIYTALGREEDAADAVERAYAATGDERFNADGSAPEDSVTQLMDEVDLIEFLVRYTGFFSSAASMYNPDWNDPGYVIYLQCLYHNPASLPLPQSEKLGGSELSELASLAGQTDGYLADAIERWPERTVIFAASNDTLQRYIDRFFGAGHTDVRECSDTYIFQLSTDKTAIAVTGLGDGGGNYWRTVKILDKKFSGGCAVLTAYTLECISYGEGVSSGGYIYDVSSEDIYALRADCAVLAPYDEVDTVLERNNIDESELGTVDYIFYMTEDGVRFWGSGPSGTVALPGAEWTNPARDPQVVPESPGEERTVTVSANGGLRMREGPSTDYDHIQMIPDGTSVRTYAEQDGWYYAKYLGRCGWISGEYCV